MINIKMIAIPFLILLALACTKENISSTTSTENVLVNSDSTKYTLQLKIDDFDDTLRYTSRLIDTSFTPKILGTAYSKSGFYTPQIDTEGALELTLNRNDYAVLEIKQNALLAWNLFQLEEGELIVDFNIVLDNPVKLKVRLPKPKFENSKIVYLGIAGSEIVLDVSQKLRERKDTQEIEVEFTEDIGRMPLEHYRFIYYSLEDNKVQNLLIEKSALLKANDLQFIAFE